MAAKKKVTLKDVVNRLETIKENPVKNIPRKLTGAGDPDYIKNMIAAGKARKRNIPKRNTSDNSYVDRLYGPIGGAN
jgi:queuine/archaeosine tRNA-ribosyltransferase